MLRHPLCRLLGLLFLLLAQSAANGQAPSEWLGKKIMFKGEAPKLRYTDEKGKVVEENAAPEPVVKVLGEKDIWIWIRSQGREGWVEKSDALRLEEAPAYFSNRIRANAVDRWSYFQRGNARMEAEDVDGAIADFTEAIRLNPKHPVTFNNRGIAWRNKKAFDKAIADYNEAIRLDPKYATAFNNRGWTLYLMKDFEKAIADYNEAIRLDPKYATAFHNRGIVWDDKKEFVKAIADYTEALRLDPSITSIYVDRGNAYYHSGAYDKAIDDYTAVTKLAPKDAAYGYGNRAGAMIKLKRYADAARDFDAAFRITPVPDWLYRDVAAFCATCPKPEFRDGKKAVELALKAIQLAGQEADWEYSAALAAAYAEAGEFAKASVEQGKALADKSLDADERAKQQRRLELYNMKKAYREE